MTNIWEQFDNNTDLEAFEEGVKNAENKSSDFEDLPHGKYEVAQIGRASCRERV